MREWLIVSCWEYIRIKAKLSAFLSCKNSPLPAMQSLCAWHLAAFHMELHSQVFWISLSHFWLSLAPSLVSSTAAFPCFSGKASLSLPLSIPSLACAGSLLPLPSPQQPWLHVGRQLFYLWSAHRHRLHHSLAASSSQDLLLFPGCIPQDVI